MTTPPTTGRIVWTDLTVPDAPRLRDFYTKVAGWTPQAVKMDDYDDYGMNAPDGQCVAGVCHARGVNAKIPPQWLVYISVPSAGDAAREAVALGGSIVDGPRNVGGQTFVVIKDPAGAVFGVIGGA